MDSQTKAKLPVIDFRTKTLNSGTSSWLSTANEVRNALEKQGCFTVVYDKITSELHNSIFKLSKQLFELPLEIKIQNTSDLLGFGYGGNFASMPLFEYFGIENGATPKATQDFANLMWPDHHDSCETALTYSKLLSKLDHWVMRMVFKSYGVEKYCEALIESSMYLMRFMKYRAPQMEEEQLGLQPHTDKNFLAIIDTNQVKGLKIQTRDGKWISFEPSPSTFVVIAGEPFMAWSNGKIYAPLHRVVMKGSEAKYTIGLFSFMREIVEVPEELVDDDDEHVLKFKPFNHLDFLQYCKEDGKNIKCPIKAYCGI